MISNPLAIVIVVLLLIIVALLGIGDLILAFLAGMELRPSKKKEDDDEIEFIETAPGQTGMRIPISRIPEVFGNLLHKAKEQQASQQGTSDENIDKHKPTGYL